MYLLPIHIIIKVCIIAILCKKSIAHYYVIFVGTISSHRLSDGYRYNYRRGDIVIVIYITQVQIIHVINYKSVFTGSINPARYHAAMYEPHVVIRGAYPVNGAHDRGCGHCTWSSGLRSQYSVHLLHIVLLYTAHARQFEHVTCATVHQQPSQYDCYAYWTMSLW